MAKNNETQKNEEVKDVKSENVSSEKTEVKSEKSEVKSDLKKASDAAFKSNPQAEVLYQTTDGKCFYAKGDAAVHAKTLKTEPLEVKREK